MNTVTKVKNIKAKTVKVEAVTPDVEEATIAISELVAEGAKKGLRGGRIAPIQDKLIETLKNAADTVKNMALKFEVTEREVRLAIDRARVKGYNIKRVDKGTFQLFDVK